MRARGVFAAATGVAGAALAHMLDVAGLLPFVHESESVRGGLGPGLTAIWLIGAGVLAAAASRRPLTVGAGAAVVVAGIPELVVRHDPGAVFEPGAVVGALMQWALLLIVIAVAVAIDARLGARPLVAARRLSPLDRVGAVEHPIRPRPARRTALSRAPPLAVLLPSD